MMVRSTVGLTWRMGAAVSLSVLAACTQRDNLTEPISRNVAASQAPATQQTYFTHERDRFDLTLDPSGLVVSSKAANIAEIVAAAFSVDPSVRVGASTPLSVANHRQFALSGATNDAVARARALLIADARIEFAAPVYRTADGKTPIVPVNQLDVQFKPGTSGQEIDESIRSVSARVIRPPRPDSGFFAYRLAYDVTSEPFAVAAALAARASVAWADADRLSNVTTSYVPSDPLYSQQFHLINTNTLYSVPVDINVEQAWNLTLGSSSLRVAVIDDGVDVLHTNSGGGFAGDMVGRFAGGYAFDEMSALATGDNQYNPYANDTHGTSVAGIIAANHNNGVGGAGIAPNVILNVIRITRATYPDGLGTPPQGATDLQVADAINQAWSWMGSDVISNSWGMPAPSTAVTTAIGNALSSGRGGKGSVVVFAAGNSSNRIFGSIGSVVYPASLSSSRNVISVSSIDRYGAVANYAPNGAIDVVTPSGQFTHLCVGEVVTTDRYGAPGCSDGPGGTVDFTSTFSGTSASAPQVSGVAALILSRYPSLTAAQVKTRIRSTAVGWGSATTYGTGKLDAFAAAW